MITEVAADKGYHSNAQLAGCDELGPRTYIRELLVTAAAKRDRQRDEVACRHEQLPPDETAQGQATAEAPQRACRTQLRPHQQNRRARRTGCEAWRKPRYRLTVAAHNLGLLMRSLRSGPATLPVGGVAASPASLFCNYRGPECDRRDTGALTKRQRPNSTPLTVKAVTPSASSHNWVFQRAVSSPLKPT